MEISRHFWLQLLGILVSCCQGQFTSANTTIDILSCVNLSQACRLLSLDGLVIPDNLSNSNISIQLFAQSSNLSTLVLFENVFHVELRGFDSAGSEIICSGESSGLLFAEVVRVQLSHLRLRGCGIKVQESQFAPMRIRMAAILVSNSGDVQLVNLAFVDSKAFGVALFDVESSSISECRFEGQHSETVASRGVFLQVSQNYTNHIIQECSFSGNGVSSNCDLTETLTGAGLTVLFRNGSFGNLLEVSDCSFERNSAQWGGAVYMTLEGSSSNNSILLERSRFCNNSAMEGGGAVAVGVSMTSRMHAPPTGNKISIIECTFERNMAFMGGSLYLFSAGPYCHGNIQDKIHLRNSTWRENSAFYGAAIDARLQSRRYHQNEEIAPPFLVDMQDGIFERNTVNRNGQNLGEGTIRISENIHLRVFGTLLMTQCTGSAVYLESSSVSFMSSSVSTFQGNEGYRGGAIALMGQKSSQLKISENCFLSFLGNSARSLGGAIYQANSSLCFMASSRMENNVSGKPLLEFSGNSALGRRGHSIYVSSLQQCSTALSVASNYLEALDLHAEFVFAQNQSQELSTRGNAITHDESFPSKLAPGLATNLNISLCDETGSAIEEVFKIYSSTTGNSFLRTSSILQTGSNTITCEGKPGLVVDFTVVPVHQPTLNLSLSVLLSECPPGYYFNSSSQVCLCSANSRDTRCQYVGIQTCLPHTFQAALLHSHWAGYVNASTDDRSCVVDNSKDDDSRNISNNLSFRTAFCPRGYCRSTAESTVDVLLPTDVPANFDLSNLVCRYNREGVLCARCTANHSVSFATYHSCEKNRYCKLGWLFYILSQLVPITVLFCVVIVFDISLTSGAVSSIIFYTQIFDTLLLTANDFLWFDPPVYEMFKVLRLLFRMFSLRFFADRKLSFCLWEGVSALDVVAFNYVTVVYSFLLIVFTVKVCFPCIQRLKNRRKSVSTGACRKSKSIIHGLSGFLVLCYAQTTTLSLHILAHTTLYGQGGEGHGSLVFYNAELEYLKGKHLYYAIPAFFFLVVVTVVPPLLLLSYPLCYRVLALCRIQESRFTRLLCKAIPLEKYKPLFDSFQGSFKDEHRYFAGLQFMYRLLLVATFVYVRDLDNFYLLVQAELILMLSISAYVQPHKKNWHNWIDIFIYSLLAIINACTIWKYQRRINFTRRYFRSVGNVGTLQIILSYLPLLYLLVYVSWRSVVAVRKRCAEGTEVSRETETTFEEIALSSLNDRASLIESEADSAPLAKEDFTSTSNSDYLAYTQ